MAEGWNDCIKRKVDLIIQAIEENPNQVFIHADVDIQFFRPFRAQIEKLIRGKDMVIQRNGHGQGRAVCAGFFAAIGNKKNLRLWKDIRQELESQTKHHDQNILNRKLLRDRPPFLRRIEQIFSQPRQGCLPNSYGIKWDYLPDRFLCGGTIASRRWEPGMKLSIPEDIILHHANWTIGIENKIAQLEYVRDIVQSYNTAHA